MKKAHLELIKKMNRELVLETIRNEQPISRARVSRELGLSRSTVSTIVEELIATKFVIEKGQGSSTKEGGRRGIELRFNPKSAFGVGVEFGEDSCVICITDLDGSIILKERSGRKDGYGSIYDYIIGCLEKASIRLEDVIVVGFSIPGITNSVEGTVVASPELQWKNKPLIREMKKYINKPMYLNNDVNCAALGEQWLGAARGLQDFIFISMTAGVGSAIVANGSLIQGKDFMAGEIGYLALEKDRFNEKSYELKDFGTFEKKVSLKELKKGNESIDKLFKKYQQGDREAVESIHRYVNHLSIGIANMTTLLNPEKVIIGGGFGGYLEPILADIQDDISKFTPVETEVRITELGDEAGPLGIIALGYNHVRDVISHKR